MKLLFFNIPAHGHVNPTLPVVAELLRRGHQVIYYDAETLEGPIRAVGAEFRPYPDSGNSEARFIACVNDLPSVSEWVLEESLRLLPFVIDEIERERPDRVAFDTVALWGMLGARFKNVPSVSSFSIFAFQPAPGLFTWRDYLYLGRHGPFQYLKMRRLRHQILKKYGPEVFPSRATLPGKGDLNVVYTSRVFHPDTIALDESFEFVGPSLLAATRGQIDFPWAALDPHRIKVYISLGTIYNRQVELYRSILATFGGYPNQFILSIGNKVDLAELGPLPVNFIVRNSVPQLELLPRVDLFVTHGGMNSVNEALNCGVPMVVIPQQVEQALNARQVAFKGAGQVLADRPPYGKVNAHDLKRSVDEVLGDLSYYRGNAEELARTFHEAGGYQRAADLIVALGERRSEEASPQPEAISYPANPAGVPAYATDGP